MWSGNKAGYYDAYVTFETVKIARLTRHFFLLADSACSSVPGSLPVLLDHLLDLFRGSAHYRKEVAIVIENVLVGAAGWGCAKGRGEVSGCV